MEPGFMDGSLSPGKISPDPPFQDALSTEPLMPLGTDFILGPFNVASDGRLTPRDPENHKGFSVRWRGCFVHARMLMDGRLVLRANLGRVPSTAGAARALREPLFAVVRGLPATFPRAWKLNLLADHRIELASEEPLELPASATELVSLITQFLLALGPYLDLMEEFGVANPPASASDAAELGSANA
jgi:hypothetical protein